MLNVGYVLLYMTHIQSYDIYCYQIFTARSHCKRCTSYDNSVRLSVHLFVTRQYCVKTTARSTVQFALSDSKM